VEAAFAKVGSEAAVVSAVTSSVAPPGAYSSDVCFTLLSRQARLVNQLNQIKFNQEEYVKDFLTGDFKCFSLHTDDLLVYSVNQFDHRAHSVVGASVDLVKDTFKCTALGGCLVTRAPHGGGSAKELGQAKQTLSDILLVSLSSLCANLFPNSIQFFLVSLLQCGLLDAQALLVMTGEVLELSDLLLDLNDSGLERGLLQGLRFLVHVDLLLCDQLIKRFTGVFRDDSINLCSCVLNRRQMIVSE
jgi:hypothetical protein